MKTIKFLTLRTILLFAQLCLVNNAFAQKIKYVPQIASISYCISHEDLKSNNWITIDSVAVYAPAREDRVWTRWGDYRFIAKEKTITKLLKKEAIAVKYDGRILVNLRLLKNGLVGCIGVDYAQMYPLKDGRYILTYYDASKMGGMSNMGVMNGVIGITVISGAMSHTILSNVCYLFTPSTVRVVRVKNQVLEELLKGHDDLIREYNMLDRYQRNFEDIIMPLLKRANLLVGDWYK